MKPMHVIVVVVIGLSAAVSGCLSTSVPDRLDSVEITHGPLLGRLSSTGIGIWARTAREGGFYVRYGTSPTNLDQRSEIAPTTIDRDNTGWVHIQGLRPNTKYYYQLSGPTRKAVTQVSGSFRTLPTSETFKNAEFNPHGLFNFSFEFGCGNRQRKNPAMPGFRTMHANHADKIHFAILNGDWLYEQKRDYTVAEWRAQVGVGGKSPKHVAIAPGIVGVWENYKHYMSHETLMTWHRDVPSFFIYDDHEILDNIVGAGTPGLSKHATAKQNLELATFRDVGVQAWQDYIGWSNPTAFAQQVHFGKAQLTAGSDVLVDSSVDFTQINMEEMSTLMVLWKESNCDVYEIKEVLGRNRLRISPTPETTATSSYTIGKRSYFRMRIGNAEFFVTDTRGHRQVHDLEKPYQEGVSMLGVTQKAWLKKGMKESTADFLFVVSTVNLMIPHVMSPVEKGNPDIIWYDNKDEAWTAIALERDELIDFWDELDQPVLVLTGDLHNSIAIKVTDNVWEFAAGPHNSNNHYLGDEGGRPSNGTFQSHRKKCDIRWSSFFTRKIKDSTRQRPIYCVVRVNNVFRVPVKKDKGEDVWAAFDNPQVLFQYYDGITGDLLYAESVVAKKK